ncbi:MAG: 30S ribosomal protein S9 [Candidatus Uhrbacteria bacterium]
MADETRKYIEAIGRRKKAIARVRIYESGKGLFEVNKKEGNEFFPVFEHQTMIIAPFIAVGQDGKFDATVKVCGGGINGQAEAVRLGIARALELYNPEFRASLKKLGYLKRDDRKRERKKPGLKSARRAPQWAKR